MALLPPFATRLLPLLVVRQDQLPFHGKLWVLAIFLGWMASKQHTAYSQKCFDQSWCNRGRGWRTTILHPWPILAHLLLKESDTGLAPPSQWDLEGDKQMMKQDSPAAHAQALPVFWVESESNTGACCYEKFQPYFSNVCWTFLCPLLRWESYTEWRLTGTGFAGGPRHQDYWSWHRWYQAAFSSTEDGWIEKVICVRVSIIFSWIAMGG